MTDDDYETCVECGGRGRWRGRECEWCGGTGHVPLTLLYRRTPPKR